MRLLLITVCCSVGAWGFDQPFNQEGVFPGLPFNRPDPGLQVVPNLPTLAPKLVDP
jgi:hypothetical protein